MQLFYAKLNELNGSFNSFLLDNGDQSSRLHGGCGVGMTNRGWGMQGSWWWSWRIWLDARSSFSRVLWGMPCFPLILIGSFALCHSWPSFVRQLNMHILRIRWARQNKKQKIYNFRGELKMHETSSFVWTLCSDDETLPLPSWLVRDDLYVLPLTK